MNREVHSPEYGSLQRVIDTLFISRKTASRLDLILAAEAADLCEDMLEVVSLLPPGRYSRHRMCDQLNSSITGHGWGLTYGTVE